MDYYCYDIRVAASLTEIALAFLSELPFESFEESDECLRAYLPKDGNTENVESELANIAAQLSFSYKRRLIPDQNWNELWEANFSPIRVGDLCGVRAHFHPPMAGVKYEVVINPRMAFGTGHHAGKRVADADGQRCRPFRIVLHDIEMIVEAGDLIDFRHGNAHQARQRLKISGSETVFGVLNSVQIFDQQIAAVWSLADQACNVIAILGVENPALGKAELVAAFFAVVAFTQFLVERVHGTSGAPLARAPAIA